MNNNKNGSSVFDDDFEVTYEEEIPFTYSFDTKPQSSPVNDETIMMDSRNYQAFHEESFNDEDDIYDDSYDGYDGNYDDSYNDNYDDDYHEPYDSGYDDNDYDYDRDAPRRKRAKKKRGMPNFSAPVKKTAKYGTRAIYRTARSVVRVISAMITAATFCILAYEFWRGAAPYGDPVLILSERNYALAAYGGIAAIILFFEFVSFFWSLTKMKFKEGRKTYKEDTGRGLFSFIFIYVTSYLSFLLCSFLPDTLGSYDLLNGAKGALDVFGSLHNVLLGLCLAGVIACLVRRHMN